MSLKSDQTKKKKKKLTSQSIKVKDKRKGRESILAKLRSINTG